MRTNLAYLLLPLLAVTGAARAEEWPGWRGPRADGSSLETNLPLRWTATENVAWKTPLPAGGHSSPVVWGDRVLVTGCLEKEQRRILSCLDRRDGKVLWERVVLAAPLEGKHRENSYASSTPATDGKHVWVSFLARARMVAVCYDLDGNEVWRREPGEFHSKHGFCSPPILYKNLVILNGDQDHKAAFLVALDRATGAEVWRAPRPGIRSYCPPFIAEAAGKTQMVLTGSERVASYDPATGKQHWVVDGPTEQFVASMVYADGLFYLTAGYPTYHLLAIRPDGQGNVTHSHVQWHETKGAGYVPSPVVHANRVYLVKDDGVATCRDARTGKLIWQDRLGRHHHASPVVADGHLYFPDDDGVTHVVKAGDAFTVVHKNPLGEPVFASPAVARGHIFLRTEKHLVCLGPGVTK